MEKTFTYIYENNIWGSNNNNEYSGSSGDGSSIEYNKVTWNKFLKNFININNINSVIDLGCGDFINGHLIYDELDILYTGYDVYEKLINFHVKNNQNSKYNFKKLDFLEQRVF
jgi:hypothetical protein